MHVKKYYRDSYIIGNWTVRTVWLNLRNRAQPIQLKGEIISKRGTCCCNYNKENSQPTNSLDESTEQNNQPIPRIKPTSGKRNRDSHRHDQSPYTNSREEEWMKSRPGRAGAKGGGG
jgi:hypothetical protein